MKKVNLFIMVILLLTACQSSQESKPITEETIDFDRNTAMEMVKKKEKMIVDLAWREKVSKLEYKEIEQFFTEEFGNRAKDILAIFFINDIDADPDSDIYINKNTLYPTVFHKGITITKAVVYKSEFENEFFNQTTLSIKEEYVGDDEKLKDWYREYIFTPNENDEWELSGYSGTMNFSGEDYNMNYLELKK
ncbi:hypothetical protein BK126_01055 [Paenibacillus sp. FSL H7-0326]|uniref:hypothetical protein n=1 Tax=Paenibacillus sp. FSL H7-0326 TaxID=1921144 RepID=UPI00096EFC70|nr:hypothetical protein [Paenibacillus sp. FSL H7-0326]OMC70742.1 hypothetical protein BK126_01055 [Paenibacillus sp. FSL H7-0326]